MYWEFKNKYLIGICLGVLILILDFYLYLFLDNKRWLFSLIVVALTIGWSQFWVDVFKEKTKGN